MYGGVRSSECNSIEKYINIERRVRGYDISVNEQLIQINYIKIDKPQHQKDR